MNRCYYLLGRNLIVYPNASVVGKTAIECGSSIRKLLCVSGVSAITFLFYWHVNSKTTFKLL